MSKDHDPFDETFGVPTSFPKTEVRPMSAPLTTRDALIGVLGKHQTVATGLGEWACACSPLEWRPSGLRPHHLAAALLASGTLVDAGKLAEDEALMMAVTRKVCEPALDPAAYLEFTREHFYALAAALSAQSERAEVEQ